MSPELQSARIFSRDGDASAAISFRAAKGCKIIPNTVITPILEFFRKCFYCIFICLGRSGIGKSPVKFFLPPPPRNFRYTKGVSLGNPRYRAIGPGNCCYRAGWPGNNCHVGCVAVITGPGGPVIAATWIARKFFPKLAARARV